MLVKHQLLYSSLIYPYSTTLYILQNKSKNIQNIFVKAKIVFTPSIIRKYRSLVALDYFRRYNDFLKVNIVTKVKINPKRLLTKNSSTLNVVYQLNLDIHDYYICMELKPLPIKKDSEINFKQPSQ